MKTTQDLTENWCKFIVDINERTQVQDTDTSCTVHLYNTNIEHTMRFKQFTLAHLMWLDDHFDEIQANYHCKWSVLADAFAAAFPQDVLGRKIKSGDVQNKLLQYWV
jgi:hypothetical protein